MQFGNVNIPCVFYREIDTAELNDICNKEISWKYFFLLQFVMLFTGMTFDYLFFHGSHLKQKKSTHGTHLKQKKSTLSLATPLSSRAAKTALGAQVK